MKSVVTERSAVVPSKMVEPSFGRNEFADELGAIKSQPEGCDSPGMNIYIKNILCGNIQWKIEIVNDQINMIRNINEIDIYKRLFL